MYNKPNLNIVNLKKIGNLVDHLYKNLFWAFFHFHLEIEGHLHIHT